MTHGSLGAHVVHIGGSASAIKQAEHTVEEATCAANAAFSWCGPSFTVDRCTHVNTWELTVEHPQGVGHGGSKLLRASAVKWAPHGEYTGSSKEGPSRWLPACWISDTDFAVVTAGFADGARGVHGDVASRLRADNSKPRPTEPVGETKAALVLCIQKESRVSLAANGVDPFPQLGSWNANQH